MILREFEMLPEEMKNESVKGYYDILKSKSFSLVLKRIFDTIVSFIMIIILLPVFIILGILIKIDSKGPIIFKQVRVTQYGKRFNIYKYRTMINNADKLGEYITINNDKRVTKIGRVIRKYRLDELPQLLNILKGEMSFVGTRPEVPKYVNCYSEEMMATLLLKAGVTSKASIMYKDENNMINNAKDIDKVYIEEILPEKMKYNLNEIKYFNFSQSMLILIKTVIAIFK